MADVQLHHGYTRIANRLLCAMAHAPWDSGAQASMVLALVRCTYGLHRKDAAIGLQEWVQLTGLSESQVKRARATLEKHGVFVCVKSEDPKHSTGKTWRLEKDFTRWKRFRVDPDAVEGAENVAGEILTAQGGTEVTPGTPVTPGSPTTPGTEVTPGGGTPVTPRTPSNPAETLGPEPPKERERKGILTNSADEDPGEAGSEGVGGGGQDEENGNDDEGDGLKLAADARAAFVSLDHPVSPTKSWSVVRSMYLYRDDGMLGDSSVKGLELPDRVAIVGQALVEYGAKHTDWSPANFAAFVRRVRARPKPGTEAAGVRQKGDPDDAEKRKRARQDYERFARRVEEGGAEDEGLVPAKFTAADMAKAIGVRIPAQPPPDPIEKPQDAA